MDKQAELTIGACGHVIAAHWQRCPECPPSLTEQERDHWRAEHDRIVGVFEQDHHEQVSKRRKAERERDRWHWRAQAMLAQVRRYRDDLKPSIGSTREVLAARDYFCRARNAWAQQAMAEALRADQQDDPQWDGSDFAHPAYWRGQEHSAALAVVMLRDVLDGTDDGAGVLGHDGLERVRRDVLDLRRQLAEAREVLRCVQWSSRHPRYLWFPICPVCAGYERHEVDCRLASALGDGKEATSLRGLAGASRAVCPGMAEHDT